MTTLRYNTFNDTYEDILIEPESELNLQCLICLNNSSNTKDEIKQINDMHFLKKPCKCICYSHHKCIESWIATNSVCPICKGPLLFPKTTPELDKNETIIDISIIDNHEMQTNSCKESAPTYMCVMGIVFGMLFLGNVITELQNI